MFCKNCNSVLYKNNRKFCNSSCSASYNNSKRIKKPESNLKTSLTLKLKPLVLTSCKKCNSKIEVKLIKKTGNICSLCRKIANNNYITSLKNNKCSNCCSGIKRNKSNMCKKCWIKSDSFKIKRGCVKKHFKRGYYFCKEIKKNIFLNSGLEFKFAAFCDNNGIRWTQPEPLSYFFLGREHLYFPDFYLIDYNLYIELKGYFWGKDEEKMKAILNHNKNKKIKTILQKQFDNITGVGELVDPPDFESGA